MEYFIGDKIRIARNIRGFSQKGLALATGLKQENISYIESNKTKKAIEENTLAKISKALGMTKEELNNINPDRIVINEFNDNSKQEIFIQNLMLTNEKIVTQQKEVLEDLKNLYELYRSKGASNSPNE